MSPDWARSRRRSVSHTGRLATGLSYGADAETKLMSLMTPWNGFVVEHCGLRAAERKYTRMNCEGVDTLKVASPGLSLAELVRAGPQLASLLGTESE